MVWWLALSAHSEVSGSNPRSRLGGLDSIKCWGGFSEKNATFESEEKKKSSEGLNELQMNTLCFECVKKGSVFVNDADHTSLALSDCSLLTPPPAKLAAGFGDSAVKTRYWRLAIKKTADIYPGRHSGAGTPYFLKLSWILTDTKRGHLWFDTEWAVIVLHRRRNKDIPGQVGIIYVYF